MESLELLKHAGGLDILVCATRIMVSGHKLGRGENYPQYWEEVEILFLLLFIYM